MSTRKERSITLPGLGAFCCGLGIIVAATILNLALDHLTERDIASLPFGLPLLYDAAGKLGVTLVLVTLGMSIIMLGMALQRPRRERESDSAGTGHIPRRLVFYSASDDVQEEGHANGVLVLQTRKYLAQANLSGTTGYPPPRQTR